MRFRVGVLIDNTRGDAQVIAEQALWHFSVDREVPEHERPCSCIRWRSDKLATFLANRKYPDLDRRFFEIPEPSRPPWDHFFADWNRYRNRVFRMHLKKSMPDRRCEFCGGSGIMRTTRNPTAEISFSRHVATLPVDQLNYGDAPSVFIDPDLHWEEWTASNDEEEPFAVFVDRMVAKHPAAVAVLYDCIY